MIRESVDVHRSSPRFPGHNSPYGAGAIRAPGPGEHVCDLVCASDLESCGRVERCRIWRRRRTSQLGKHPMLSYPVGIAYDANGNLLLPIRPIVLFAASIMEPETSSARSPDRKRIPGFFDRQGSGDERAQMQSPSGLVVDSNNNVYVADRANNVVFKITPCKV